MSGIEEWRRPERLSAVRIFGTVVCVATFMVVLGLGVYARMAGHIGDIGLVAMALVVLAGLCLARVGGDLCALMMAALLVLAVTQQF